MSRWLGGGGPIASTLAGGDHSWNHRLTCEGQALRSQSSRSSASFTNSHMDVAADASVSRKSIIHVQLPGVTMPVSGSVVRLGWMMIDAKNTMKMMGEVHLPVLVREFFILNPFVRVIA